MFDHRTYCKLSAGHDRISTSKPSVVSKQARLARVFVASNGIMWYGGNEMREQDLGYNSEQDFGYKPTRGLL